MVNYIFIVFISYFFFLARCLSSVSVNIHKNNDKKKNSVDLNKWIYWICRQRKICLYFFRFSYYLFFALLFIVFNCDTIVHSRVTVQLIVFSLQPLNFILYEFSIHESANDTPTNHWMTK